MIRYIYDIYFLLKWRSRIKRDVEAIYVLDYAKSFYKRKGTWQRKQFAKIIREIRKEKPYQVIDFSEAEKLFKSQESRFNFREVQEGSFVTKDKEQCAYRGTRFSHYFIDNDNRKGVFRVGGWQDSWERYEITDYKGYDAYGLREDNHYMFRMSTPKEIEEFKSRQKEYLQKRKQIEKLEQEISKLYDAL